MAKTKLLLERTPLRRQDSKERIHNWNEVALGYSEDEAVRETQRCIDCKKPKCVAGCPVEIDIPGFVNLIREKDFIGAARKIKENNVLPAICGRVCPQEVQCQETCILGRKGDSISIGALERFVADYEAQNSETEIPEIPANTGKKVAVVGSGPAGLTLASDMAKLGHTVTLFEALHKPGGVLVYGIPEFRLPKAIVARECEYVRRLGVEIKTGFVVGKTRTIDELFAEGYDAIFLATGAGLPRFMKIPGENLNGVYSANEWLTRINLMKAYRFPEYDTPVKVLKKVAVVGGGNTAMDAARCALRLGADVVYDVYRRSRKEMPARIEEIENAQAEGIQFNFLVNPVRIIGDGEGWVKQMECIKMELGEPDESGRRRPVPIEGSEFKLNLDIVVIAIGQSPNPLIPQTTPGIETGKWGNIVAEEETGKTSMKGVFAGGDIVTGEATVILAMGAGRRAAKAMDEYLRTGEW
ncbi:MAG: NADPH-dependent glutamate synthase [bacterium]